MDFVTMQNRVLTDRFDETKRADSKVWLNHRAGRLWSSEPWVFKLGIVTLPVASGAVSVSMGSLQRILTLRDASVTPGYQDMDAFRPEDFHAFATSTSQIPHGYTVVGSTIYFDSALSSARTFTVVGELSYTQLVADADLSLFPVEFHDTIVHGARSEGLREENDPTWQGAEEDFKAGVSDLKQSYLVSVRNYQRAYPGWP